jgi:hypothetical protein
MVDKMFIKLFRNITYDYTRVADSCSGEFFLDSTDDHIAISEPMEVEFTMLSNVDINGKKVKVLDKEIKKALATLEKLELQKAELLAITDQSGDA